jgi:hypothetical protein
MSDVSEIVIDGGVIDGRELLTSWMSLHSPSRVSSYRSVVDSRAWQDLALYFEVLYGANIHVPNIVRR